tara:strand:+ start:154 stop:591 length:438 start_codon:yes stop_codon:yes gene_type:complete
MKIIDDAQDYNHSSFDKLNEILNVAETAVIERERPEKVKPPVVDNELDTDYQYARENYYNVIERGHDALDELLMEAKENGNARMYEVVGQLIKVIGEQNNNLLNLHQQVKDITKEVKNVPEKVTNALFVGSTSDLQKLLKGKRDE